MYMHKGVMNAKCLIVKDWSIFTIFTILNSKWGRGVRSGQPLLKYFLKNVYTMIW